MALKKAPGQSVLTYHPAKVAWATAEFVRQPPAIAAMYSVYLALGLVLFGLGYTWFAKVPVSIKASGVLITEKAAIPIVSVTTAQVASLVVQDNQLIKKGDVILTTDLQLPIDQFKLLKQQVRALQSYIVLDHKGLCPEECFAKLRKVSFDSFAVSASGSIKDLLVQQEDMLHEYVIAKTNALSIDFLLAEEYRTIKSSRSKLKLIKARHAEDLLAIDVERIESQIGMAQTQVNERHEATRNSVKQARERLEVRLDTLLPAIEEFRGKQTLRAPADGIVNNLRISAPGQQIAMGQAILDLIPADSPFIGEVQVQNQDISKIAKDMPVLIRLTALNELDFGVVHGTVIEVPVSVSSAASGPATYKVKVRLDRQEFRKGDKAYPFRLGMALNAQIVASRERIAVLGIKQILHLKEALLED